MFAKLLSTPTAKLGKFGRFVVFQVKLWSHCARLLKKNRAGQQAAALSYHTIFGIVPLAIVTVLIFHSLPAYSGIGEQIKTTVYQELHLDIEYMDPTDSQKTILLTEQIDNIVNGFFTNLDEGKIAIISTIIIIWAALAMLSTIERAFNNIWHVGRRRSFIHRIINYWALLTLGPLLIGVGIYIVARYSAIERFQENVFSNITPAITSYLISTVAFFLLYFILPNTKVKAGPAICSAAIAALVWATAKYGFGIYVKQFIPYSKVYGVLGLIPLAVLWIYISWLIVLFGLQLTFTTQHLKNLDAAEIASAVKNENYFIANDVTAINVAREIATAFETGNAPIEGGVIASRLNMPAELSEKLLNRMVEGNIIARVSEPKEGFVPVKDPADIYLTDISDVVRNAGFAQSTVTGTQAVEEIAKAQRNTLAGITLKQTLGNTCM